MVLSRAHRYKSWHLDRDPCGAKPNCSCFQSYAFELPDYLCWNQWNLNPVWGCLCMSDSCMCVCAWYACLKRCQISWKWTYRQLWFAKMHAGTSPLHMQQVLLTAEPSFQLCELIWKQGKIKYRMLGDLETVSLVCFFWWSHQKVLRNWCLPCLYVWVHLTDVVGSGRLGSWTRFQRVMFKHFLPTFLWGDKPIYPICMSLIETFIT